MVDIGPEWKEDGSDLAVNATSEKGVLVAAIDKGYRYWSISRKPRPCQ
jgi:hypothetical protein